MKKPAKLAVKIIAGLIGLIIVVFIGLSIFVSTLDADKYRPQLIAAIEKQTGRTVKMNGPIKFSLGFAGVHVSIQDASISNPSWASRPVMAGMGKFELAVGLLPLLHHELSISELKIENADILLETNAAGQHNYDFEKAVAAPAPGKQTPIAKQTSSATGASLSIDSLSITNSQLAMRDATGHVSSYNVASLLLTMGHGAEIKFKGDIDGQPVTLNVKTSITDLLSQRAFTFDADLTYSAIHLTAKGKGDVGDKTATISSYEVTAGKSKLNGELAANWGGVRPNLKGSLKSDYLNPADFQFASQGSTQGAPKPSEQPAKKSSGRMFPTDPLPLSGLKAVDASLDASIGEFVMNNGSLTKMSAKILLNDGNLSVDPAQATIAGAPSNLKFQLNASQLPAHLVFDFKADGIDLSDLQKLSGMAPFITGKAGADIQLASEGMSAHDFASNMGGIINITAEKGEILTGAAAGVSSALAAVFSPKGGNDAMNCLAARFIVKNGVMNDNGILIDSAASEVAGKGNVNLGGETVNLILHAKTKLVDIGGLVPALQISGPLNSPGYSVDAVGTVTNAVGGLLNGKINVLSSDVPDIQTAPAGQNACVYTLDHPQAASQSTILPSGVAGKAQQQIQDIGNSLMKGLLGK